MEQLTINVSGRVQGVLYRASIEKVANTLGLSGYVKNNKDGTVTIVAQGKRMLLQEILKWSQKGSLLSKVEGMSFQYEQVKTEYKAFEVINNVGFIQDKIAAVGKLGERIAKRLTGDIEDLPIPKHVLVIPDGNRRWAKEKGWEVWKGHEEASNGEHLLSLVEEASKNGVKYLTFWAMSTENWSRDQKEIDKLFEILKNGLNKFGEKAKKYEIRFQQLGRKDRIPKYLLKEIEEIEEATKNFDKMFVQVALDYGGQDELLRAINKVHNDHEQKIEITADIIREYLDANITIPDPDLIIRTSGEQRTSGALLWQSHYAEFYFTDVYFPDFGKEHLRLALLDYAYRVRRFGGTKKSK